MIAPVPADPLVGSRVYHWFAGLGTVKRAYRNTSLLVDWDNSGTGIAFRKDCVKQPTKHLERP